MWTVPCLLPQNVKGTRFIEHEEEVIQAFIKTLISSEGKNELQLYQFLTR